MQPLHALLLASLACCPLHTACAGAQDNSGSKAHSTARSSAALEFDGTAAWQQLETIVGFGPRPAESENLERLRGYLIDQLKQLQLEPVREDFVGRSPFGGLPMANIYVDLPAAAGTPDPQVILIGTHFDTKKMRTARDNERFVGANDGGSGTAVLLELARVLSSGEPRPVTYRLLFLDGEEALRWDWGGDDNTYGSRHHVQTLTESGLLPKVRAFVLLDMVGDADLKLSRDTNSDSQLLKVFETAAKELDLAKHVQGRERAINDDHIPFINAGVRSVDLIDFDYGPYNRYWHSVEDTLEHCSKESLTAIGRIVLHGLPALEQAVAQR